MRARYAVFALPIFLLGCDSCGNSSHDGEENLVSRKSSNGLYNCTAGQHYR